MIIKRRAMGCLLIPLCYLLLSACGGGGDTAAPTTTPTTTPSTSTALTGKLIPETRQNGFSQTILQDPVNKAVLDDSLSEMSALINRLAIRFPVDIPVFFSGCGQVNAFYASAGVGTVHAGLRQKNPSLDAETVFGVDQKAPAIVYCHEMSEKSFNHFRFKVFTEDTDADRLFSKITHEIFSLSVFFHELGHAILGENINQIVDTTAMQNELSFPNKDTCLQTEPKCETLLEDFADWISGYAFSLTLNDLAATNPDSAKALLGGFVISTVSWGDILGTGGDADHGFTDGRMANILCYVYGGVAGLRDLDKDSAIANYITTLSPGITSADSCQGIFTANKAATIKHLGFALPN